MNKIIQKLTESNKNKNFFLAYNHIPVYVLDSISVLAGETIKRIEKIIPKHMVSLVHAIKIGDFRFLNARNINAIYDDEKKVIYVSNKQDSGEDLLDDIIHEIAHSVEGKYTDAIYLDGTIMKEFLAKRNALSRELKHNYDIGSCDLNSVEFSTNIDDLFYKKIGYKQLRNYTDGLFMSPYGSTSLREYFANSFEHYYLGDRAYLQRICPNVYNKINYINNGEEQ